jgi:hypothetical protein
MAEKIILERLAKSGRNNISNNREIYEFLVIKTIF